MSTEMEVNALGAAAALRVNNYCYLQENPLPSTLIISFPRKNSAYLKRSVLEIHWFERHYRRGQKKSRQMYFVDGGKIGVSHSLLFRHYKC